MGGFSGYADFLDAIADPKHEEHSQMREWYGGQVDPDEAESGRILDNFERLAKKWAPKPRKPKAASKLGYLLKEKGINIVPDFAIARVDNENKKIVSWDEKEVPFDLLVTVPTNMGDDLMLRSGLGDDLNFVPTNKHTLQSEAFLNIFV